MDQQTLLSLVDDLNTLPLETRWLLRGIQLGLKLSGEVEASREADLARVGLPPKSLGDEMISNGNGIYAQR